MDQEQLKKILRDHKNWILNESEGERAVLSGINLHGIDLRGVCLSKAFLQDIDLSGANLSRAELYGANLSKANLCGANLCGAYLYSADLHEADLSRANLNAAHLNNARLFWADLSRANLSGAVLRMANLNMANLYEANLQGTDLRYTYLLGATGINHFIFVQALGSRKDITQWDFKNNIVLCGCFQGTLDEFITQNERRHKDNPMYLAEYREMIRFFQGIKRTREKKFGSETNAPDA
jgi:hypothetical protein